MVAHPVESRNGQLGRTRARRDQRSYR